MLLIDDDADLVLEQVTERFPGARLSRELGRHRGTTGLERVRAERPDVILLDLHLPDGSGLDFHGEIRAIDARSVVVFVTMEKTADAAIEAMKQGAFNYLYKPLDLRRLRQVVDEAAEVASTDALQGGAERDRRRTTSKAPSSGAARRCSRCTRRLVAWPLRTSRCSSPGRVVRGKELVARAVYQHSARSHAPFLALNCAAIPENLLESELFGHEKGAFTGADRRRIGKFEQCRGGTILLDEIGDMPLSIQAKVLRLLQDQTFERVGGNERIRTDVRLIAATHRDLRAAPFRSDLFYRLGVFSDSLAAAPRARRRPDRSVAPLRAALQLASLAETFARSRPRPWRVSGPTPGPATCVSSRACSSKPCSTRRASSCYPGFYPSLSSAPAPAGVARGLDLDGFISQQLTLEADDLYAETHRHVDRILLSRVLEFTKGNHRHAARLLGIARQTMRTKLRSAGSPKRTARRPRVR